MSDATKRATEDALIVSYFRAKEAVRASTAALVECSKVFNRLSSGGVKCLWVDPEGGLRISRIGYQPAIEDPAVIFPTVPDLTRLVVENKANEDKLQALRDAVKEHGLEMADLTTLDGKTFR